jgi:hypothetical protein
MSVTHLPATATAEDVGTVLARDGAAIIDRLVDPDVMDRVREELSAHLAATKTGQDAFSGARTRRTGGLVARSVTCRDLVMHPLVLGSVGRVLADATNFQLHLTQVIAIAPGEIGQQIHRDTVDRQIHNTRARGRCRVVGHDQTGPLAEEALGAR